MKKVLDHMGIVLSRGLLAVIAVVVMFSLLAARDGSLPRVFGRSHLIVVSGSMEPALKVGDLIVIRKQDYYQAGDIITFREGNTMVTHRLIDIQGEQLITKGDANNTPDSSPVSLQQVEGCLALRIPMVGRLLLYLKTTPGIISALLVAAILTLLSFRKETT
ncbi:MAG: signal peptidase I [Christensenellales bacterium]|nr:signal peptidase I [Clostridiales bacterium]